MMFDHGTDSLASFLLVIQFFDIIQIFDAAFIIISLYFFVMITYFSAMWNQYSSGFFKLGRINPVDEGLPIVAIFCLFAPHISIESLNQVHWVAKINEEIIFGLSFLLILQLIYFNKNSLKNSIK
eukprot:GHVR01118196.1.p1 GENE.GHVR01118196.1~~GHVR01118196.1.p1  ORF type:complete len:125 (-),score=2.32 GHVR01118196.1:667-1041(-)